MKKHTKSIWLHRAWHYQPAAISFHNSNEFGKNKSVSKTLLACAGLKTILGLLLTIIVLLGNSQDVITLKTGDEIKGKVLEVDALAIKYKKAENINGPTYSISRPEIFMIHYENGTKEVFNTIGTSPSQPAQPTQEVTKTKSDSTTIQIMPRPYRKDIVAGAVMTSIGAPLIPVGLTLTLVGVTLNDAYDPYATYPTGPLGEPYLIAGAVLLGAGTALTIAGPIVLSRGIHKRKLFRQQPRVVLNFNTKSLIDFDRCIHTMNYQKL